jgi:hypothetical protein
VSVPSESEDRTTKPGDQSRNDRADDAWLDALRGRPSLGTDEATLREAQSLRDAVLDATRRRDSAASRDAGELERLMFRLRREGLLEARPSLASGRSRWRAAWSLAATVVLGLAVALMLPDGWHGSEQEAIVRGSGDIQKIEAADVPGTVRTLVGLARSAGGSAATFELSDGAVEVAATIPEARIDEVRAALAQLGLKAPGADGALRVEVHPIASRSGR